MARRLQRSPSTISRELRRNVRPHDNGVYDGDLAEARARERAERRRPRRLALDAELRAVIQEKLLLEWSPEQIQCLTVLLGSASANVTVGANSAVGF